MSDSAPDAVTPFVQKPGQAVVIQSYQVDEKGYAISRVTGEWFGFTNPDANAVSFGLNGAVEQYIHGLANAKAAGAVPPGQAKQG
jgi:hypothetical protein